MDMGCDFGSNSSRLNLPIDGMQQSNWLNNLKGNKVE